MTDYWLTNWVRANDIGSTRDLRKAFKNKRAALKSLEKSAQTTPLGRGPLPDPDGAIVASAALDLSGLHSCNHPECLKKQVDELFGRVWHYFDQIVVTGLDPRLVRFNPGDDEEAATTLRRLAGHIRTCMYLQQSDAAEMLVYRAKDHVCTEHLAVFAEKAGLNNLVAQRDAYVDQILKHDLFTEPPKFDGRVWRAVIRDPFAQVVTGAQLKAPARTSPKRLKQLAAEQIFHVNADGLASDLVASHEMHAPLAIASDLYSEWIAESPEAKPTQGDVAFALTLPVLEGMSLADIVKVRRDEYEHFAAFRQALKVAIRERIASSDTLSATDIAQEIADDVILPALNDISRRLEVARAALNRKAEIHTGVGLAVTTVGLLSGISMLAAAGIAAAGLALPHVDRYLDMRADVQLNDMYFLWNQKRKHA